MAALRRQGLTFKEIGARLGCSERTARRYVGNVLPQLNLPQAAPEPEAEDPRRMRDLLARGLSDTLYRLEQFPQPRLSVAFLAEATRLIQKCLEELPPLTLELMMSDSALRTRFLKETVGALYTDYKNFVLFDIGLGGMTAAQSAAGWRPPGERPERSDLDDEDIDDEEF